jgi:hypothetical protein
MKSPAALIVSSNCKPDQQGREDRVLLIGAEFQYECIFRHAQYILPGFCKEFAFDGGEN